MTGFLLTRLIQGVVTLLIVTFITFFLINAAPGGPSSMMQMTVTADERHALSLQLGLDQPVPVRYVNWLEKTATGNLGKSLSSNLPVSQVIKERFANTLQLAVITLVISLVLGIGLGVAAARRRGSILDFVIGSVSILSLSIPTFWLAILLILLFSVDLHWLPASGMSSSGTRV